VRSPLKASRMNKFRNPKTKMVESMNSKRKHSVWHAVQNKMTPLISIWGTQYLIQWELQSGWKRTSSSVKWSWQIMPFDTWRKELVISSFRPTRWKQYVAPCIAQQYMRQRSGQCNERLQYVTVSTASASEIHLMPLNNLLPLL